MHYFIDMSRFPDIRSIVGESTSRTFSDDKRTGPFSRIDSSQGSGSRHFVRPVHPVTMSRPQTNRLALYSAQCKNLTSKEFRWELTSPLGAAFLRGVSLADSCKSTVETGSWVKLAIRWETEKQRERERERERERKRGKGRSFEDREDRINERERERERRRRRRREEWRNWRGKEVRGSNKRYIYI